LLATGVTFMTPLLAERRAMGIRREQAGNTGYYTAPSDAYRTRDGWILVPTIGDDMFRRWARLVGREELINDPRCKDDITRGNNSSLINEAMRDWCAARTRDEAINALERARIPCGPVYDLDDVLSDPQVNARGLLDAMDYAGSAVPIAVPPVRLGETPGGVRGRAPRLGEHTDEVLTDLGFAAREIAALRDDGVV
jgi:crotonobetainyl-CoA:carnitine CoA-transferase CaiB-like acyl-CoA transferase